MAPSCGRGRPRPRSGPCIARRSTARRRSIGSTCAGLGACSATRSSSGACEMKLAIHQPHYLPWLGYFAKWAAADLFVFLDTVQYEKNGWQNRNRIKTREGARWLTVPVRARLGTPIREVLIDSSQPWRDRHFAALESAYGGAPGWGRHHDELHALYEREWERLAS